MRLKPIKNITSNKLKISGKLDDNWSDNLGDILLALLPAGSIQELQKINY